MRNNNGANILVVDDEEGMRLGLTKILEKEGYRVTTAANGEKALNLMERISFDLVISDLKMPKYSGIELLKTINKINTGSPLIIITAYASLESAIEAIKERADDYLVKPFGREELVNTVRRVIEKRKKEE
ncbi:MAG: response regulator, partial [Actinomycetia bacterium]|nr:response regulator [Actinomycetes bacterium]